LFGENSLTNIVNNTFAFAQVVDVISCTEITGDVVVAGDLNVIGGSLDISGVTIKSYEEEEEERLFDTLVIRYPTLTGTGKFHGIREIQLWVNNVNVLPSLVTPSTFNVDGTPLAKYIQYSIFYELV